MDEAAKITSHRADITLPPDKITPTARPSLTTTFSTKPRIKSQFFCLQAVRR